jgi:predicted molibdopterin-dependent oxidoreductase YjgC
MVTLFIDGTPVSAQSDTTILEAALSADIYIPNLCYHQKLRPIGSCRLCVVEIDGVPDPVAACTTPVQDGLKVTTRSAYLEHLRREAIQYILVNHPLDCPVCDKAGECRLQDLCHEFAITGQPLHIEGAAFRTDYSSPLIEKHDSRCVMCGRCVSICTEVQGVHALEFVKTGYDARIGTVDGMTLDCEFCGQCVAVCPVGALISKLFKYRARVWDIKKVASVCPYCGTGCSIELNVKSDQVLRVTSDDESTFNRGNLCIRGSFGYGFVHNKKRLHTPLIKKGNKLLPVSWDTALDYAADSLKSIMHAYGPDSIAGLGSAHATNEDNYIFQKFFRAALGTNNIDSVARFDLLKGIEALQEGIGFPASTNSFTALNRSQSIFIIGADFSAEMPVVSLPVIQAARDRDAFLIVASPAGTKLDQFATTRLRYHPHTERLLLAGIIKVIIDSGLENKAFLEKHTDNLSVLRDAIANVSLDEISTRTGVTKALIEKAAREITAAETGIIICSAGMMRLNDGEHAVQDIVNILLLSGHLGKEYSGCLLSASRNNIQGLCDMGVTSDRLPGYRQLSDNEHFKKSWGKSIPEKPGIKATEFIEKIEKGTIKALYLMGCDPIMSFYDSQRARAALEKLEFLLVQDLFLTQASASAHCCFPAASFAEKEGSFTSGERRIQWIDKAVASPPQALPDWLIIQNLSQRFDYPLHYKQAWDIFQEIQKTVPQYRGASHGVKNRNGVQWPVADDGTGTPFLQEANIKGHFFKPNHIECPPPADATYPFSLIIGSSLYHCGTLSTYAEGPMAVRPAAWIEMNPRDAMRLGVTEGEHVDICSQRGEITVSVKLQSSIPEGLIFAPNHFSDSPAHTLTTNDSICHVHIKKSS